MKMSRPDLVIPEGMRNRAGCLSNLAYLITVAVIVILVIMNVFMEMRL